MEITIKNGGDTDTVREWFKRLFYVAKNYCTKWHKDPSSNGNLFSVHNTSEIVNILQLNLIELSYLGNVLLIWQLIMI